jgi:L-cysteine/cystine lyase
MFLSCRERPPSAVRSLPPAAAEATESPGIIPAVTPPSEPDGQRVAALRDVLPATSAGIYLNTGTCGPLPAETAKAMADLAEWELRVGRAHPDYWAESLQRREEARAAVAALLGSDPARVALTHATGDGMQIAAWSVDWRSGDRAVTTTHEHPAGIGPLYALRQRFGIEVVPVEVGDDADPGEVLEAFARAITPRTRLVVLSHVSWLTGAIFPVADIARLAHDRGAMVAVDGAQAAGAIPVRPDDLDADFYALSGQKWLLGPEGTGALWCSPRVLDRPAVVVGGYLSFEASDARGGARWWPDARRYEGSNDYKPAIVGLARSVSWLSMFVGLDWIYRRAAELARETRRELAAIPGVTVLTPADRMATLVSFRVAGWESGEVLAQLQRRAFVIARTVPAVDAVRFSVGFFNTREEIQRALEVVELVARHRPESLPPAQGLTVVPG